MKLAELPKEIHHEIFSYLDYVRDVCCHRRLLRPSIDILNWSREQFETLLDSNEIIPFDDNQSSALFFVCKSLLKSICSYQPLSLQFSYFVSNQKKESFPIDKHYRQITQNFPWIDQSPPLNNALYSVNYWSQQCLNFIKSMKRLCFVNPFHKIEHVSIYNSICKNTHSLQIQQGVSFCEILHQFPNVKSVSFDFYSPTMLDISPNITMISTSLTMVDDLVTLRVVGPNKYVMGQFPYNNIHPLIPVEQYKTILGKYTSPVLEVILCNFIYSENVDMAKFIIEEFELDIQYFAHVWNLHNAESFFTIEELKRLLDILSLLHDKYRAFKIFSMPIRSVAWLDILTQYPFIDITFNRNITLQFAHDVVKQVENGLNACNKFGIDLSKIGKFKFSILSLDLSIFEKCKLLKLSLNDQDVFGVTPVMIQFRNVLPFTNEEWNYKLKDNYGNNILHYAFSSRHSYHCKSYAEIPLFKNIPADELVKLEKEENQFSILPIEVQVGKFRNTIDFEKRFIYEGFKKCSRLYHSGRYILFDGNVLNLGLFLATTNVFISPKNYEKYKDINYRDVNGKQLVHYLSSCFDSTIQNMLGIPIKDMIFCKDRNGTMPIQTCVFSYSSVLSNLWEGFPKINFSSHADEFGFYRVMYLMIDNFSDIRKMEEEISCLAFDYTSTSTPQLISLLVYYENGCYSCSIESSPLSTIKNFKHFGCVDGDDISHFFVRYYLYLFREYPTRNTSIMSALIAKGMRLNVVKNSEGKTAFDILEEELNINQAKGREFRKVCKRGLRTKSKAIPKFTIKIGSCWDSDILLRSETFAKFKRLPNIRLKRTLYFP